MALNTVHYSHINTLINSCHFIIFILEQLKWTKSKGHGLDIPVVCLLLFTMLIVATGEADRTIFISQVFDEKPMDWTNSDRGN